MAERAPRGRNVKILATLGPASQTPERVRALRAAGADAFRINMSHGSADDRARLITMVRELEGDGFGPMTILADLQGPKIRIGRFAEAKVQLVAGQPFRLDLDPAPGGATRVQVPHPEVLSVLEPGHRLLLDDGKVALNVVRAGDGWVETEVVTAGALSNNKGLNVPDTVVPTAALTAKDRDDLALALDLGVDWIALSFVQRAEDEIGRAHV